MEWESTERVRTKELMRNDLARDALGREEVVASSTETVERVNELSLIQLIVAVKGVRERKQKTQQFLTSVRVTLPFRVSAR